MTADQDCRRSQNFGGITAIGRMDLQNRVLRQVTEKYAALDLRLNDFPPFEVADVPRDIPTGFRVVHEKIRILSRCNQNV